MEGIIVKAISGFYYVKSGNEIYTCRGRGILKKKKITPVVGDRVLFTVEGDMGSVDDVLERTNILKRPPVANVSQVIITFAVKSPSPNINLLDKMIAICEYDNLNIIICFNKADLDMEYANLLKKKYENIGYKVIITSALHHDINELKDVLKDNISVFAGPSGVGKSSLLNEIHDFKLEVGSLSKKIDRGKHTTRHSEIYPLKNGGYVVDTPGFTSIDLNIDKYNLSEYFIEFNNYKCKFDDCIHINEPGCKVKEAVENGLIATSRYESYKYFINKMGRKYD